MNLDDAPFSYMKDGLKKIEVRLYDERRKNIRVGDEINFVNSRLGSFKKKVREINIYSTMEELVASESLQDASMYNSQRDWVNHIKSIYSNKKIQQYGLVVFVLY